MREPLVDFLYIIRHRDIHFKTQGILQIVQRVVVNDDQQLWRTAPPRLIMPGAITECNFGSPSRPPNSQYHAFVTNSGMRMSLEWALHKRHIDVFLASAEEKESEQSRQQKIQASSLVLALLSNDSIADPVVLQDLQYACEQKKEVVAFHDGGISNGDPFGSIMEACPDNLRHFGLFDELALEWHRQPAEYHNVSVCLVWELLSQSCQQAGGSRVQPVMSKLGALLAKKQSSKGKYASSNQVVPAAAPAAKEHTRAESTMGVESTLQDLVVESM